MNATWRHSVTFICQFQWFTGFFFSLFLHPITTTTTTKARLSERNEMRGESSKKSHTHSLIVTKTGNKRGKENKKPAHPALGMRVWRFWHEFCYVCVACPIPTRLCYTQPKFGCRGKVCLFFFSLLFVNRLRRITMFSLASFLFF